ncbi:MAG: class II aldolase [Alphaproteobacteria bacterium]|nr:MAG: class II aldolase [Alphaproteobacteria bacterium]
MADLAQDIIGHARAMSGAGLGVGTSGNVSARVDGGFLITPSGVAYEDLVPDRLVTVAMDGNFEGQWVPSSEWRFHRDIYAQRPDAGAVVHCHSAHATALACLGEGLPAFHYMVAIAGGDDIRCADYATFGSQALSDAVLAGLGGRQACLMANHGHVALGRNVAQAFALAREVEALCHQYLLARQAGEPVLLSADEMKVVLEKFKSYGKQPEQD